MFFEYWQVEFSEIGASTRKLEIVKAHEFPKWTEVHTGCTVHRVRIM